MLAKSLSSQTLCWVHAIAFKYPRRSTFTPRRKYDDGKTSQAPSSYQFAIHKYSTTSRPRHQATAGARTNNSIRGGSRIRTRSSPKISTSKRVVFGCMKHPLRRMFIQTQPTNTHTHTRRTQNLEVIIIIHTPPIQRLHQAANQHHQPAIRAIQHIY